MPSPEVGVAAGTGGGACLGAALAAGVLAAEFVGALFGAGLAACLAACLADAVLTACFGAGLAGAFDGCLAGGLFAAGLVDFVGDDLVGMLVTAFDAPFTGGLLGGFADRLEELAAGRPEAAGLGAPPGL